MMCSLVTFLFFPFFKVLPVLYLFLQNSVFASTLHKAAFCHSFSGILFPALLVSDSSCFRTKQCLTFKRDRAFLINVGGTSVVKVDVKVQAPKLHYVQPSCFEAGKPLEFVACGSNLIQPKLRYVTVSLKKLRVFAVTFSVGS